MFLVWCAFAYLCMFFEFLVIRLLRRGIWGGCSQHLALLFLDSCQSAVAMVFCCDSLSGAMRLFRHLLSIMSSLIYPPPSTRKSHDTPPIPLLKDNPPIMKSQDQKTHVYSSTDPPPPHLPRRSTHSLKQQQTSEPRSKSEGICDSLLTLPL